jgi:transcriptional regulator GlxA family with amidase domain
MGARQPAVLELLAEWVHRLAERLARRQAPDARLQRLFAKVDERLGDPWDLQSLALEARLSGEQLRRLCQREYGQSPMERVRVLRMARAAALIRRGAGKLEPMALALGYSSLYAFSTAFRRSFGVSPSEYRRTRGVASG